MSLVTDKRATVLDAAIELVGTEGLRALTHRRVDAIAGVPAGSTSNYFRTRQALVEGVLDRLLERDRVQLEAIGAALPGDARELEDLAHGYVMFVTGDDLVRTRARFAMFVEAMATPNCVPGSKPAAANCADGSGPCSRASASTIPPPPRGFSSTTWTD